ncbi:MAG: nucleotidyltransferase [Pirellulaceae bacterium]
MPDAPAELRTFHQALSDLDAWLTEANVPGVVIGGVAVALLARPRLTRDLDIVVLVDESQLQAFVEHGSRHGFILRRSDAVAFAVANRVLLMRHLASSLDLDVSLGMLGFERDMIASASTLVFSGIAVRVPRPEDLFLLKAIAQRDRDLNDLSGIVARVKKLDVQYIRQRAKQLAEVFERPELPAFVESFFGKKSRK